MWGARVATIAINVLTGKVERIDTSIKALNSLTILTMGGSIALAVEAGFDTPRKLMIAHIGSWDWVAVDSKVQVSQPDEISSILKELICESFVVKPIVGPEFPLEALLFQKKGRSGNLRTTAVDKFCGSFLTYIKGLLMARNTLRCAYSGIQSNATDDYWIGYFFHSAHNACLVSLFSPTCSVFNSVKKL